MPTLPVNNIIIFPKFNWLVLRLKRKTKQKQKNYNQVQGQHHKARALWKLGRNGNFTLKEK